MSSPTTLYILVERLKHLLPLDVWRKNIGYLVTPGNYFKYYSLVNIHTFPDTLEQALATCAIYCSKYNMKGMSRLVFYEIVEEQYIYGCKCVCTLKKLKDLWDRGIIFEEKESLYICDEKATQKEREWFLKNEL